MRTFSEFKNSSGKSDFLLCSLACFSFLNRILFVTFQVSIFFFKESNNLKEFQKVDCICESL